MTGSPENHFLGDSFSGKSLWGATVSPKIIKSGMNGVAVARHGLIFGEDGATGSRKVSGYLRGLPETI